MRMGYWEILIIVLLVVILFGSAKIPGMMRNLAGGIKVFKKELKDTDKKPVEKKEKTSEKPVAKSVAKSVAKKTVAKKSVAGKAQSKKNK